MCFGDRRHGEGNRTYVHTRVLGSTTDPVGAAFISYQARPNLPPRPQQQFHVSSNDGSQRPLWLWAGVAPPRGEAGTATTSLLQWAQAREACRRTIHSLSDCHLSFIEACCCSAAVHRQYRLLAQCMYIRVRIY